MSLYFASQGAGQLLWPLVASFVRIVVAGGGGYVAIHWFGAGLFGLFVATAIAVALYGLTVSIVVGLGAWNRAAAVPRPAAAPVPAR